MAEPQAASGTTTLSSVQKPRVNQGFISGKIDLTRKNKRSGYYVRLVLPAPDAYTSPQTVELESSQRLGEPGEDWSGYVHIGGYRNEYDARDEEGEKTHIKSARNVLRVVE